MPQNREALEAHHGRVFDQNEFDAEFVVTAYVSTTVVARRKADNQVGLLDYQNEPRFYFNWRPQNSASN